MIFVLNVLYDERVGGPQLRVLQVAQRLRGNGIETHVVFPKGDRRFAEMLEAARIPFHELDLVRLRDTLHPATHLEYAARFWPTVRAIQCLIREHNIQIVHTNGLMNLQAAIAARREGVRLVWHLNDIETPRLVRLGFLPLARAWADGIAVAARAVGEHCFPNGDEPNGRMHVLYAPVDTARFRPETDGAGVRAELGISSPVIGVVGNFSPGKGFEYLLEAAPAIRQRYPTAKFLLVGELLENRRAYWTGLMRRRDELKLANDLIFAGRREDMPEVYGAMTVFVQASEAEACPMAVLEASASGLPVVATDVGGTRELVEDGMTGLLVEPCRPDEIAEAVLRVLDASDLARRMGQAGAERMRKFFSLDACVASHARLYESVLGRAPGPRSQEGASLEAALHRKP